MNARLERRLAALQEPVRERTQAAVNLYVDRLEELLPDDECEVYLEAIRRWQRGEAPPYTPEEQAISRKVEADPAAVERFQIALRLMIAHAKMTNNSR